MNEYIKFLVDTVGTHQDNNKKKDIIRYIIKSEAKFNNDLLKVISNTGPKEISKNAPQLYQQFQTNSFDLLQSLGFHISDVFDETKDPTEEQLQFLEDDNNTKEAVYSKKKPAALNEFSMRKFKILSALAGADALSDANIVLAARLKNLELATRHLAKKMEKLRI